MTQTFRTLAVRAGAVIASTALGGLAHDAAAGPYLYVPQTLENRVDVIDAASHGLHDIIPIGAAADSATLDHTRRHLYVLSSTDQSLTIVDTAKGAIMNVVALGAPPAAIYIPDDDAYVYVALEVDVAAIDTIVTVDTAAAAIVHTLKPGVVAAAAVSADGKKLYTYGFLSCRVDAFDTQSYLVLATTTLACADGGNAMALDHADSTLFLAGSSVRFYDATTLAPILSVSLLGMTAQQLIVDDRDRFLYAVGPYSADVIDIAGGALSGPALDAPVDCTFDAFALADDGRFAYVRCVSGGVKIDLSSWSIVDTVHFFSDTYAQSSSDFVGVPPANIEVANGGSASISTLDPLTRSAAPLAMVGASPAATLVSADGKWLYAANKSDGSVSVVSVEAGVAVATIPTGAGAAALALSPDAALLYVANETDNSISIVDTALRAVLQTIPISDPNQYGAPHSLALTRDGGKLYAALSNGYDIYVLNTATLEAAPPIYCGSGVASLALSPDGALLYATSGQSNGSVYQIDTASDSILHIWNAYTAFINVTPDSIAVSPDGTRLYVGSRDALYVGWYSTSVATMDAQTGTVLSHTALDGAPSSLAAAPDGRYVYAAIEGKNEVSIIDTTTQRVAGSVTTFQGPTSIAPIMEPLPNLIFRQGFDG